MRPHYCTRFVALLFVPAAVCLMSVSTASAQVMSPADGARAHQSVSSAAICQETFIPASLKDALRQVCLRKPAVYDSSFANAIVIGFVGGFVKRNDSKHPEVQFAAYLRDRYASRIEVDVFSNHDAKNALREVERVLDADGDGTLSASEKQQARIIIYGHSWGASQTVTFARELGKQGIPVLLTIQLDSIAKPGQSDSAIPPNVASAVNFYQSEGILRGRSEIFAADPARTRIIGNFQMTYRNHPINCDNYAWVPRTFNKPHHEIENDPRVWDQLGSLIDAQLSSTQAMASSSRPSE